MDIDKMPKILGEYAININREKRVKKDVAGGISGLILARKISDVVIEINGNRKIWGKYICTICGKEIYDTGEGYYSDNIDLWRHIQGIHGRRAVNNASGLLLEYLGILAG